MIRRCTDEGFELIFQIINDGAQAYKGVIPDYLFRDPYMSREELRHEIADGVDFWGYEEAARLSGVMGIQHVKDVTLIRHAYVRTDQQSRGIGTKLFAHLRALTSSPVLIGTWADAHWAIRFYEKHGFQRVSPEEKDRLLRLYWSVPEDQIAASLVLADERWRGRRDSNVRVVS
jgi:GNAT superfamily N-acetyltransferase